MTFRLQSVDPLVVRSLKCAFRSLLARNILQHVDREMENPVFEPQRFKIN